MPALLTRALVALKLFSMALLAQAASVQVLVQDAAGRPLPHAVVYLESREAKAATKPLRNQSIAQVDRQFSPRVSVVTVGSQVSFPNDDRVRHHVYSFSPAKTFELKLYAGTPASPVEFDRTGVAVLGCNIHDDMVAWVLVLETPYHARTGADGRALLDKVPAGSYRLRTWHEALPLGVAAADQALQVGADPSTAAVQLSAIRP